MITVVCGVLEKNGKVLAFQRKSSHGVEGKWEFPGGKVEPGEELKDALQRELQEELNISVEVGEKLGMVEWRYPDLDICLHAFRISKWSGEITLNEHAQMSEISVDQWEIIDWSEADRALLTQLKFK